MMRDKVNKLKDKLKSGLNWLIAEVQDNSQKLRCIIGIHQDVEKNYFTATAQGNKITITEVDSRVCSNCKREAIVRMNSHEIPLPLKAEGLIVNTVTIKKRVKREEI